MESTPRRRFTISDGMILVVALALACACAQGLFRELGRFAILPRWWGEAAFQARVCLYLPLSLAVLVLRLRRPRPPRELLWMEPGWAAAVAVAVTTAFLLALRLLFSLLEALSRLLRPIAMPGTLRSMPMGPFVALTTGLPGYVPCAVLVAWAILGLSGRWMSRRDWVDRLGIVFGFLWVADPILVLVCAVI